MLLLPESGPGNAAGVQQQAGVSIPEMAGSSDSLFRQGQEAGGHSDRRMDGTQHKL